MPVERADGLGVDFLDLDHKSHETVQQREQRKAGGAGMRLTIAAPSGVCTSRATTNPMADKRASVCKSKNW